MKLCSLRKCPFSKAVSPKAVSPLPTTLRSKNHDQRSRAIAFFQTRSSGNGNGRSPSSYGTIASRDGRTFRRSPDRHIRHQNRSRAALKPSSQPRRSKCHHNPCGSNRALWLQLHTGMMDLLNVAASKMQVGTMMPSRDHRIDHIGRCSWPPDDETSPVPSIPARARSCAASSRIHDVGAHRPTRAQPGACSKASATDCSSIRSMDILEHKTNIWASEFARAA